MSHSTGYSFGLSDGDGAFTQSGLMLPPQRPDVKIAEQVANIIRGPRMELCSQKANLTSAKDEAPCLKLPTGSPIYRGFLRANGLSDENAIATIEQRIQGVDNQLEELDRIVTLNRTRNGYQPCARTWDEVKQLCHDGQSFQAQLHMASDDHKLYEHLSLTCPVERKAVVISKMTLDGQAQVKSALFCDEAMMTSAADQWWGGWALRSEEAQQFSTWWNNNSRLYPTIDLTVCAKPSRPVHSAAQLVTDLQAVECATFPIGMQGEMAWWSHRPEGFTLAPESSAAGQDTHIKSESTDEYDLRQ